MKSEREREMKVRKTLNWVNVVCNLHASIVAVKQFIDNC